MSSDTGQYEVHESGEMGSICMQLQISSENAGGVSCAQCLGR